MTASAQIQKGDTLRQQGQLEAAIAAYQAAIQNDPQSVEAYQRLAEVLHEFGELDQAAHAYQQAIALHPGAAATAPNHPSPPAPEEDITSDLAQLQALIDQQDWSSAIALGQQVVKETPSALALKLLGMALQFEGQLSEALDAYQQAIALEPEWAEVWANIGSIKVQQQQWNQAVECYEWALVLKPSFAGAYRNLARVWETLDQLQQAATCWYQALLIEPEYGTPQENFQLGKQLLLWDQVDWAIDCFEIAIQKNPALIEAREHLAEALQHQEGTQAAPDSSSDQADSVPTPGSLAQAQPSETPSAEPAQLSDTEKLELAKAQLQARLAEQDWQGMLPYCQYILEQDPDSQTYRLLGNALQQLNNLEAAQRAYEKALEYQPDSAETYTNLGALYAQEQQWEKSVQHLQQAIALKPDFAGAHRNLARAWEALEKIESATECWYQALRLEPEKLSAAEHLAFGDRFRRWGQIDRAVECYQFALRHDPTLLKVRLSLAETLSQLGRWQEAVEQYQALVGPKAPSTLFSSGLAQHAASPIAKVVDLLQTANLSDPEALLQTAALLAQTEKECLLQAIAAYRERGNAAQENGDWQTAAQFYEQVVQLDETSAIDWGNLGTLYARQLRWDDAIHCYKRAVSLDDSHATFHWNLAQVLSKLKRSEDATEAYYRALTLDPERATAEQHCALGNVFVAQQKLDTAIDCYERSLSLDPAYVPARFYWAEALVKQGNVLTALEHYRQVIQEQPENSQYWHGLGDALLKLERYADAVPIYERAIALNQSFSWSYNNLGDALLKLERYEEAAKAYQEAIALNPEFPWSYYNLGEALTELKDWDGAIAACQAAYEADPNNLHISKKLGMALRLRAQYDQARANAFFDNLIKKKLTI